MQKVALVTGAAHGIGAGIAARLAGNGYRVIGADLNDGPAPDGGCLERCDVSQEGPVAALMNAIAAHEAAWTRWCAMPES